MEHRRPADWGYSAEEINGHFPSSIPPMREWRMAERAENGADEGSFVDNGWRLQGRCHLWANVDHGDRDHAGHLVGYAKLTRDLTESRRVEAVEIASQQRDEILEAERSARMAAQRATRVKDEFLATLSHELRTPLSAILGWTQVLLKGGTENEPARQRRAIEVIDRNARAQVQLIDDLLDMSRIMTGKIRLDLHQVSLPTVVEAAVDSAKPAADAKDIRLKAILDQVQATVNADGARLQQVVWNLLTKIHPRGPGSVPSAWILIQLSVSDTIGIPAKLLPRLRSFQR
jgi:signal transduction histidine kinase